MIKIRPTAIPEVLLVEPSVYSDERGFFLESWSSREFEKIIGASIQFVQDNHSRSMRNVLRGLHYQVKRPQGKLISVTWGRIFDVAVDLRKSSSTFGRWIGTELSDDNHQQLWIPPGFAHGFWILSDHADVVYKVTDYYAPQYERCLLWNDPTVCIDWPKHGPPNLSIKDRNGVRFSLLEVFE